MMTEQQYMGPYKLGDVISDRYEIRGFLGAGGYAFVYDCFDTYMETYVALKVIPGMPGRGSDLQKRAKAEAKLLFRLNHPNVVRVVMAMPLGDSMVGIMMEKLEGLTLREMLVLHKRLTVTESLRIVRQIAAGVGAAHKISVIHRDIKPENVFVLPPDSHVKVLDFGIAKFTGQGLATTNKARVNGTPVYMSPEHLQNISVTARSDIYELGTVAFELMTGKIPCLVNSPDPDYNQMAHAQITQKTPPLTMFVRDVSPQTEYLIQRATAKEPMQRFASMDEMISAIDNALAEQLTLFPREADTARCVNDGMIRDARIAMERALADESEEDSWEPESDANIDLNGASNAPATPSNGSSVRTLGANEAKSQKEAPPANVQVPARVRKLVMAPTIQIAGVANQSVSPAVETVNPRPDTPQSLIAVRSANAAKRTVKTQQPVVELKTAPPPIEHQPSVTGSAFSGSVVTHAKAKAFPLWMAVTSIALGMVFAVVLTWPEIQRYRARTAAHGEVASAAPSVLVVTAPEPTPIILETAPPVSAQPEVTTSAAVPLASVVSSPPSITVGTGKGAKSPPKGIPPTPPVDPAAKRIAELQKAFAKDMDKDQPTPKSPAGKK